MAVLRHLGVEPEDALACGDAENDVEMLRCLAKTGEVDLGAGAPDSGVTAAFLAIEYDRPAVLARE